MIYFELIYSFHFTALILRDLDALTTEETVCAVFNNLKMPNTGDSPALKNVSIMRDDMTRVSKGYGFAELASISEAVALMEAIRCAGSLFEIDGKAVSVNFARNTFSTIMAKAASLAAHIERQSAMAAAGMADAWVLQQMYR